MAFRASVRHICREKPQIQACQRRTATNNAYRYQRSTQKPTNKPPTPVTERGIPLNIYKDRRRPEEVKQEVEEKKDENEEKSTEKPKNRKIPFETVMFVNPEGGGLVETTMTKILADMDDKNYFAELQSTEPFPVVKLINKEEARQFRQKAKEALKKGKLSKEFQLTWSMAEGDLARKLNRVRETLAKGGRVDLVFAPKPGQKGGGLPFAEMKERMQKTVEDLSDTGTEWKPRQFRSGSIAAAFLQGNEKKSP
ncbi:hypothetical protein V5O48_006607 [Marasmius crinis-equi]|uniref:Translation initiation factor 3 N-terminal domain-containing protein n=1 Tax=Marasmius crinis-equi TaxID=585013 RepID=A0ABR3FJ94_9AGAR